MTCFGQILIFLLKVIKQSAKFPHFYRLAQVSYSSPGFPGDAVIDVVVFTDVVDAEVTRGAAPATAAATTSEQLCPSGKTPGAPRAVTKYPVRGNPSLSLW